LGELGPRVRRAIEGPKPLLVTDPNRLSDGEVENLTADAVAEIILVTQNSWGHTLTLDGADDWSVDPALSQEEQVVVASQAALDYFFHQWKSAKVQERMKNEGREWEYTLSARLLQDQLKLLQARRDEALGALAANSPVLVRYASILHARDSVMATLIEPFTVEAGGRGGGVLL
jgi:hypothetical protein